MHSTSDTDLVKFTDEDKMLFRTRFDEGYDLDYPSVVETPQSADVS